MDKKVTYWLEMADVGTDENVAVMDKEQALEIARRYKRLLSGRLPFKAFYLYGSYSKGEYHPDSDIDIAVVVDRLSDDYFEDTPLLWKLRRQVNTLIEPVLLTEDLDNPLYRDVIRTGILI